MLILYNGPIFRLTLAFSLTRLALEYFDLQRSSLFFLLQGARVLWLQNMLLCTANMLWSVFTKHGAVHYGETSPYRPHLCPIHCYRALTSYMPADSEV